MAENKCHEVFLWLMSPHSSSAHQQRSPAISAALPKYMQPIGSQNTHSWLILTALCVALKNIRNNTKWAPKRASNLQSKKKKKKRMWVVKKVKAQEERINKMGKTEKTCYLNHESCNKISFPTHINDCCSGSHSPFPPNHLLWPKTHRCTFCSPWQFSDTFHGFK